MQPQELTEKLTAFLKRSHGAKSVRIDSLLLLTGGASRQTWSFDATIEHGDGRSETLPLVMRSDIRKGTGSITRDVEYKILEAAFRRVLPLEDPRVERGYTLTLVDLAEETNLKAIKAN